MPTHFISSGKINSVTRTRKMVDGRVRRWRDLSFSHYLAQSQSPSAHPLLEIMLQPVYLHYCWKGITVGNFISQLLLTLVKILKKWICLSLYMSYFHNHPASRIGLSIEPCTQWRLSCYLLIDPFLDSCPKRPTKEIVSQGLQAYALLPVLKMDMSGLHFLEHMPLSLEQPRYFTIFYGSKARSLYLYIADTTF